MNLKRQNTFATVLFMVVITYAFPSLCKKKPPKWATGSYLEMGWSAAMPAFDTYHRINRLSLTGAFAGYRIRINRKFSAGIRAAWNMFEMGDLSTNSPNSTTASAYGTVRLGITRLSALGHYYLTSSRRRTLLPFFGLGLGGYRAEHETLFFGDLKKEVRWHLGMSPEMGVIVLLKRIPFLFAISANLAIKDSSHHEAFVSFSAGVAIPN